jgi:hypothetical protein
MTAVLRLAPNRITQNDVDCAWATYRAMILAEVDDPLLLDDHAHQAAKEAAREKYQRLYGEWSRE